MTETHTKPETSMLNEDELTLVSGGMKDLLGGMPTQVNYIGAFMSGYYSTCGCSSTGHSANWQG
jgi:hypothetical protein